MCGQAGHQVHKKSVLKEMELLATMQAQRVNQDTWSSRRLKTGGPGWPCFLLKSLFLSPWQKNLTKKSNVWEEGLVWLTVGEETAHRGGKGIAESIWAGVLSSRQTRKWRAEEVAAWVDVSVFSHSEVLGLGKPTSTFRVELPSPVIWSLSGNIVSGKPAVLFPG